ncbi:SDR family NAD(P)-dependent oxidoreductase [Streptomyces sp. 061-3]|uniref:SDR family NAD(P)-dependent oxidoreductase n=1 Tax=Streptomyces sp. 061-3 TaxID=2789268 RepID=UPI0039815C5F
MRREGRDHGTPTGALDDAAAGIGASCSTFKGDVAVASDVEALYTEVMARHGRLDTVIANAGAGYHSPLGSITEEEFDQTFNTNAKGVCCSRSGPRCRSCRAAEASSSSVRPDRSTLLAE